jgi:hypothetical protein
MCVQDMHQFLTILTLRHIEKRAVARALDEMQRLSDRHRKRRSRTSSTTTTSSSRFAFFQLVPTYLPTVSITYLQF